MKKYFQLGFILLKIYWMALTKKYSNKEWLIKDLNKMYYELKNIDSIDRLEILAGISIISKYDMRDFCNHNYDKTLFFENTEPLPSELSREELLKEYNRKGESL
jgi:hypothetical protein